jgi:hypothetical protein
MKTILLAVVSLLILVFTLPSCYLIHFEKEIEMEFVFDTRGDRSQIYASHLVDLNEYSSDFSDYCEYIEDIDILSINCRLNEFNGSSGQMLTEGTLTISDESGDFPQVVAIIPEVCLEELYINEQELTLQPGGKSRVEELILTSPHTCLGYFTGEVDELPSDFIITFYIKVMISGSLL